MESTFCSVSRKLAASVEGARAREQLIQHHAKGKNIAARVQRLAPRGLLGRHVSDRAEHHARPRALLGKRLCGTHSIGRIFHQFRQPEISQLGISARHHKDVGGLEIAMQDFRFVRRRQTVRDAGQEFHNFAPGAGLGPAPGAQRASINVFGNQILASLELAGVIDRNDMRMVQRRCGLRFPLKTAAGRGIGQLIGKDLHGDGPVQLRVERFVNDAHAAFTDLRLDHIGADLPADSRRHHGGGSFGALGMVFVEQRLDRAPKLPVAGAGLIEIARAFARRTLL